MRLKELAEEPDIIRTHKMQYFRMQGVVVHVVVVVNVRLVVANGGKKSVGYRYEWYSDSRRSALFVQANF